VGLLQEQGAAQEAAQLQDSFNVQRRVKMQYEASGGETGKANTQHTTVILSANASN
jgi:hypothetical protein